MFSIPPIRRASRQPTTDCRNVVTPSKIQQTVAGIPSRIARGRGMSTTEDLGKVLNPTRNQSALVDIESFNIPGIEESPTRLSHDIPNIVIFGEAGVGKSSIINLISGEKRAQVSNDALGCTFGYERHVVELEGKHCALWDTTGLDEGTEGAVPAKLAEDNLKALMVQLARSGGIHLVMYCIRATRLTTALKRNYDLFYVTVCRKKVSVALIVTGLEHQEGEMETWWEENKKDLQDHGMWFDGHACVTALDSNDDAIKERRSHSQRLLRDLILRYAQRRSWKNEPSLISLALPMLRGLLRDGPVVGRKIIRRVIVYDGTASCGTDVRLIGEQQLEYECVHVDTSFKSNGVYPPRPGMLVFYTSDSAPLNDGISSQDITTLEMFYGLAGGKTCPVVVVLRGCSDNETAGKCWDATLSQHGDVQALCIADTSAELDGMIERLCIGHIEVRSLWKLWKVYTTVAQLFR